jgi:hypothetical protein
MTDNKSIIPSLTAQQQCKSETSEHAGTCSFEADAVIVAMVQA